MPNLWQQRVPSGQELPDDEFVEVDSRLPSNRLTDGQYQQRQEVAQAIDMNILSSILHEGASASGAASLVNNRRNHSAN